MTHTPGKSVREQGGAQRAADRPMQTMQEIAEALKLSRITVSSVVNDCARARRISTATEERVLDYLEQVGYVPSRHARDLRQGRSDTVGLLYSGNLYYHLGEAFRRLSHAFSAPELLEVMLLPDMARDRGLRELIARRVSRLVWLHARSDDREIADPGKVLPLLRRFPVAVIYNYRFGLGKLEQPLLDAGVHLVGTDRRRSFRLLARRLLELGHRRVALCFPDVEEALAASMRAAGLDVVLCAGDLRLWNPPYARPGHRLAEWILANRARSGFTAVCVGNDEIAAHAMVVLRRRGVRIPADLSLVGHTGVPLAEAFAVPLATLQVPLDAMVRRTLELLSGTPMPPRRHCFASRLIERESLGPPGAG